MESIKRAYKPHRMFPRKPIPMNRPSVDVLIHAYEQLPEYQKMLSNMDKRTKSGRTAANSRWEKNDTHEKT